MPAGLGGGGYMAIKHETVMGTYLPPTTAGTMFIPILSESMVYTEDKYFSPQIRQQTIVSEVKPSYYHVEGDIEMEVDTQFLPYLLYCSRHIITKTGAVSPFTYDFKPGSQGSASAGTGNNPRTASITFVRNGVGFGYAGCVFGGYSFTVEDGVLKMTLNAFGLSEATPGGLGTPAWVAPRLHGADATSIFTDAAGPTPGFATAAVTDFNGYTFTAGFNAEAQVRIRNDRSASYISYGETEANVETELDFIDKTEFNNFKASTKKAFRLESLQDGVVWSTSDRAVRIDVNNGVYETYEVGLGGMADLIMAGTTIRAIGIAGGSAFTVSVKSTQDVT